MTDLATEPQPMDDGPITEINRRPIDEYTDREMMEHIFIQNDVMIGQHEKIIELMAGTMEAVEPLMGALGDSPMARQMMKLIGVDIPKPEKKGKS